MANRSAILSIRILGDASKATAALTKTQERVARFQSGLTKVATGAAVVAGGMAVFGKAAVDSASRLQQAQGAVESVFGGQASAVNKLAKGAANAVGLAQSEYSELASVLGAQLSNLGVSQNKIVGTTDGLITKGADLAATFGGTTADAVEALTAAFRGETDPIEKYGIAIKDADVKARMAADGTDKLTGAAAKAAKTQAILGLIADQSKTSVGQYGRELGSAAGSAQRAASNWEDAKAALGTALLPAMSAAATKAAEVAGFIQQNSTAFTVLAAIIAGIAGIILVAQGASLAYSVALGIQAAAAGAGTAAIAANNVALGAYAVWMGVVRAATLAWTAVQWALNLALSANPIALIVLAIAALVAGIIWAWNNVDGFRDAILKAWEWIKTASAAVWEWLGNLVATIWQGIVWYFQNVNPVGVIITHWDQIVAKTQAIWNGIVSWITNTWNKIINGARAFALGIAVRIALGLIQMKQRATAQLTAFVALIKARFNAAVAFVRSVPGRIVSALSNLGGRLRSSGRALIMGFVNGIKSAVSNAVNAARNLVSRVRDFFPFSPAKRGPLSGSGYTDTSGAKLTMDFAEAMLKRQSAVKAAAAQLAGAATLGGEVLPVQIAASGTLARTGRDTTAPPSIVVNVNGALDPPAVARQIRQILDTTARQQGRMSFGART